LAKEKLEYLFPDDYPENLRLIILQRKDLLEKGYYKKENERSLVIWIILHGIKEYPGLLKGDIVQNEILCWLSKNSSDKYYSKLPRIILGIWDLNRTIRLRFPKPNENKFFLNWIKIKFDLLTLEIPKYAVFFPRIEHFSNIDYFLFFLSNIFWKIKLISLIIWYPRRVIDGNISGIPVAGNLNGFQIQFNVIRALIYRELKTRISQVRFGVLGVFLEPIGVFIIFCTIFTLFRGQRADIDIELFLAIGIVLYSMFQAIAIQSINAMQANEALFFYRPVKPIDTVLARTVVESCLFGIVFVVLISLIFLFKEMWVLENFALVVIAYLGLALFSFGLGLILMIIGHKFPISRQILPLFIRPLWLISGVIFGVSRIPYNLRPFVTWNPILQAIELTRYSFTSGYNVPVDVISLSYLWTFALIISTFGLFIYLRNEKFLLTK
tara:strand:- start:539 stop:1855 length:1317 start_codon:yes stop_codon:yes gene_type:complete